MKKLNLNSIVKVKLNPYGTDIFYHKYDELNKKTQDNGGKPIEPRMPEIDKDGFTKFQFHEFMNVYGNYIAPGSKEVLSDINIYINDEDLEEFEEEGDRD